LISTLCLASVPTKYITPFAIAFVAVSHDQGVVNTNVFDLKRSLRALNPAASFLVHSSETRSEAFQDLWYLLGESLADTLTELVSSSRLGSRIPHWDGVVRPLAHAGRRPVPSLRSHSVATTTAAAHDVCPLTLSLSVCVPYRTQAVLAVLASGWDTASFAPWHLYAELTALVRTPHDQAHEHLMRALLAAETPLAGVLATLPRPVSWWRLAVPARALLHVSAVRHQTTTRIQRLSLLMVLCLNRSR
jgi:hypothetical protein